jgi:ParB-like chromosome segregation protein Spo0J
MERFGLIEKPVINLDNTIISGHQRIQILKKQGTKEIECWLPDRHLTDKEVDELLIRLNKNHASWDYDLLANSFEVPDLIEYGFTTDELEVTIPDEKPKKGKKKKECPNCGHEF